MLAARGEIDFKTFLFCNVGDDSENPKTLVYLHEVARPYAQAHGLEIIELQKKCRDGSAETIYQRLTRPGSRSISIPVRMNRSGAPGRRACTYDFKIAMVDKWIKDHVIQKPVRRPEEHMQKPLPHASPPSAQEMTTIDGTHGYMPITGSSGIGD